MEAKEDKFQQFFRLWKDNERVSEIAKIMGTSVNGIYYWMRKYHLSSSDRAIPPTLKENNETSESSKGDFFNNADFRLRWERGDLLTAMGEYYGKAPQVISNRAKVLGLKPRMTFPKRRKMKEAIPLVTVESPLQVMETIDLASQIAKILATCPEEKIETVADMAKGMAKMVTRRISLNYE